MGEHRSIFCVLCITSSTLLHTLKAVYSQERACARACTHTRAQARLVRLERAKRSVSKDVVVVPRFDKAWSSVPLHGGGTSGEGEASAADLWWESTMPKPFDPSTKDTILWKEGDTTPREEARNLVHKYHGKAVPAGYRGLWDDIPEQDRLQQDLDRNQEKFVKSMKVHKYETEAEKKERIRKWEAMSLIEQRKFERAQSSMSQQSAQEEQDREAALDAEEQARLDQLEMQSYEEMMSEYREYEQLKKGRTSYCEGEWICPGNALCATAREAGLPKCSDLCAAATYVAHERARPSPSQDPAAYFKWGERLKKTPTDLRHPDAKFRAKTVMRFADMTEFLKGDEAAMILELGVVEPLLEVWEDSYNETSRDTVWGYLHSSKQGSPEMMERHIHIIGISFCRAMRNLTCALLTDFNLQPVAGKQQPGTIAYTWMDRPATFLEILVRQPGVFDMLCRHLSHDNDECKEHAAYALKNLTHQNDAFKQLIIDAKTINYAQNKETPVLEIMRLNLEHKSFHVQESTGELLSCLFFSDQARAQVLKHRGVKGVSMLPTVCRLMTHGSDHSQAIAARIVWDMCVKCRRDWKAQQRSGQKPKSLAAVKRSVGGKTTIEEANNLLGDGSMADFVKQDLCREPGTDFRRSGRDPGS